MEQVNDNFSKGHTQVPHWIFHCLLLTDLSKRELKVVLLVIRLTLGCQKKWAKIKQRDLSIIGVGETHAKEVLSTLLETKIILLNEKTQTYGLNEEFLNSQLTKSVSINSLDRLIGKQLLKESYQNGKEELTETVSKNLPNKEVSTSQDSKLITLPKQEVLRSSNDGFTTPKDILKINKYSDKDIVADNNSSNSDYEFLNPKNFTPSNEGEAAALYAWENLEPNNPFAFKTTYYAVYKKGLPAFLFYQFTSEIKQDPTIKNLGAIFNNKVSGYFEQRGEKEGAT
jgi:phage replication O-like protein O